MAREFSKYFLDVKKNRPQQSQFVRVWQALCLLHGLKQIDFVRRGKMAASHVNRLWNGEYPPSKEDFKTIVSIACRNEMETAKLVQARLLDCLDVDYRHLVKVLATQSGKENGGEPESFKAFSSLAPQVQEALTALMGAAADASAAEALIALAKAFKKPEAKPPPPTKQ